MTNPRPSRLAEAWMGASALIAGADQRIAGCMPESAPSNPCCASRRDRNAMSVSSRSRIRGHSGGAQSALLPDILGSGDGYVLARSLLRIVAQSTQILGYAVGGLLLLAMAPRTILLVDALTFVGSAAMIRLGTRRRPARVHERSRIRGQGLRILLGNAALRRLLWFQALVPAFAVVPEALAVPYLDGSWPTCRCGRPPALGAAGRHHHG
jgi:hypothetical protein